jgi:GT2 family glycosyltransferase
VAGAVTSEPDAVVSSKSDGLKSRTTLRSSAQYDRGVAEGATFSVVIPAHAAAATVAAAVESALGQVPVAPEVIVVLDGPDPLAEDRLAAFGEAIRVVRQPHGGPSQARNAGVRAATGAFVDFLDADDEYLPGRHAALRRLTEGQPELDLLTTDVAFEVEGAQTGTFYGANIFPPAAEQRIEILRRNWLTIMTAVRREVLLTAGGFDERLTRSEDWECWIRIVLDGGRAGLVNEVLARYRLHDRSLTAARAASLRSRVTVLDRLAGDRRLTAEERAVVVAGRDAAQRRALAAEAGPRRGLVRRVLRRGR